MSSSDLSRVDWAPHTVAEIVQAVADRASTFPPGRGQKLTDSSEYDFKVFNREPDSDRIAWEHG